MAEALLVHQALVEALQRQAIDRGHQPVLISTGISSLLLIGEHAYKLRKPLNLGFLDFSSLEQRRIDCDTELVLNRTWRPALSITGSLTLTYTLLISVHLFLGTPSILLTLAPGLAPTIGFAFTYAMLMYRENADAAWTLALKRCQPTSLAPLGGPHARA